MYETQENGQANTQHLFEPQSFQYLKRNISQYETTDIYWLLFSQTNYIVSFLPQAYKSWKKTEKEGDHDIWLDDRINVDII